jgi:hypothetical protein
MRDEARELTEEIIRRITTAVVEFTACRSGWISEDTMLEPDDEEVKIVCADLMNVMLDKDTGCLEAEEISEENSVFMCLQAQISEALATAHNKRLGLAKRWRALAGEPKDWETPGNPTDTAIRTAGRATMTKCAEELEAL